MNPPTRDFWANRKYAVRLDSNGRLRPCVRSYTLQETIDVFHKSYVLIQRNGDGPCWEWQLHRVQDGYGKIRFNGKDIGAHRFSWILHFGPVEHGLLVCHHCDNPPCCNPAHLFLGTDKSNSQDALSNGRLFVMRGSDNHASKLTEQVVKEIHAAWIPYKVSARKLAERFPVTAGHIEKILRRQVWKHIS